MMSLRPSCLTWDPNSVLKKKKNFNVFKIPEPQLNLLNDSHRKRSLFHLPWDINHCLWYSFDVMKLSFMIEAEKQRGQLHVYIYTHTLYYCFFHGNARNIIVRVKNPFLKNIELVKVWAEPISASLLMYPSNCYIIFYNWYYN